MLFNQKIGPYGIREAVSPLPLGLSGGDQTMPQSIIRDSLIDASRHHQGIKGYKEGTTAYHILWLDFIECFTTTFLRAHSWLNRVDEDDDEHDEVGLKEKPEDTRYIKKITSK